MFNSTNFQHQQQQQLQIQQKKTITSTVVTTTKTITEQVTKSIVVYEDEQITTATNAIAIDSNAVADNKSSKNDHHQKMHITKSIQEEEINSSKTNDDSAIR